MADNDNGMPRDEALARLTRPDSVFAVTEATVDGVTHRVFEHTPRNLGAWFALSAVHAERDFIVYGDERYTFAEVAQRTANLAHQLVTELGVAAGDRVVICMRNYPEWCVAYMAITSIGAVGVPLNGWWVGTELAYGIVDSGAKVAILKRKSAPFSILFLFLTPSSGKS